MNGHEAPGRPERLDLPLHLEPAARALFDELPGPVPAGVVDAAAAALAGGADALARRLAPGIEIVVDAYRVRAASGCPAAAGADAAAPFEWSPATAARTLGLRALAYHLQGAAAAPTGQRPGSRHQQLARPVEAAVEEVVDDLIAGGGQHSPGPWLAALPPAGRAVAVAHARRWAEQAVAWLPLRLVGQRDLRFLQDDWWPPRPRPRREASRGTAVGGAGGHRSGPSGDLPEAAAPGEPPTPAGRGGPAGPVLPGGPAERPVVVHGRRDVTVDVGGRRVGVTLAGGTASAPGLGDVDALTALAALLCDPRGRLVRVVRVHPASGEVAAVDVTPALLQRGCDVVLATAALLAEAAAGPEARTVPGPGCTWCHRQEGCEAGQAWLGRPDRRSMGLPLVAGRV